MSIEYRVYSNSGTGGPIDYSTPIGFTTETQFTTSPLSSPSDNKFGIRSYDTETQLEEANTNVCIRIVIDSEGRDVTRRPNKPFALFARPLEVGSWLVSWVYDPTAQGGPPREFVVTRTEATHASAPTVTERVHYVEGCRYYSVRLTGLEEDTDYNVAVTACGALDHLVSIPALTTFHTAASVNNLVQRLTAQIKSLN